MEYKDSFSSFSVQNLQEAEEFYHKVLGIDTKMSMILELHPIGGNPVMIYEKPDHQPARFTVLNFKVYDILAVINSLKLKGISMEQYDDEVKTDENGVHTDGKMKVAWFKDPFGNILSIIQEDPL